MTFELTMSRSTILYVEDDPNDVLLFKHALERAGDGCTCNLLVLRDSEEAIDYMSGNKRFSNRQQFPLPQIALVDLKMPRLSGFELLAWIREQPAMRRLPVVVLSSSNHLADISRAYDTGANSYLVKPIDFGALVELARSVLLYWLSLNHAPTTTWAAVATCQG